jgi:hypothetical protein
LVYFILSPKYRSRVTGAHTVQKFAKKWMAHCEKTTFLQISGHIIPVMIFGKLQYRTRFLKALFPAALLIHLGARAEARA